MLQEKNYHKNSGSDWRNPEKQQTRGQNTRIYCSLCERRSFNRISGSENRSFHSAKTAPFRPHWVYGVILNRVAFRLMTWFVTEFLLKIVLKDGDILNIDRNHYSRWLLMAIPAKCIRLAKYRQLHSINWSDQTLPEFRYSTGKTGNQFGNIGFAISKYAKAKGLVSLRFCGHGAELIFMKTTKIDHTSRRNTGPWWNPEWLSPLSYD